MSHKWNHSVRGLRGMASPTERRDRGSALLQHVPALHFLAASVPLSGYTRFYSPGHLPGCFHSLGGMENAAMNTGVQFWCGRVFISQGCTQEWNCWVIWQLYV